MVLKLYNTLTRTEEEFKPLNDGKVSVYSCGPTVYDYAHIGNLRSYIFSDTLRRVLEYNNYQVKQVINITDVGHLVSDGDIGEDKMAKALEREGKPMTLEAMKEVGEKYTQAFKKDLTTLNIQEPHELPKASDNITEDVEIIKVLLEKGVAYTTDDAIYFDTKTKEIDYDQIFGIKANWDEEFARVIPVGGKRNHQDFALWKFSKPNEVGFDSSLGKGFPGWHIECSAMSKKYLDQPFDIHTGGTDHIPVHHKNEIAQSQVAFGVQLANYWLHNAFVNVDGGKMSKSLNNFFTLHDIEAKGFSPLAYRYWLLTAHYRTQVNFTWDALAGAQTALNKLYDAWLALGEATGSVIETYQTRFLETLNQDLNLPQAVALVWELVKDPGLAPADTKATLLAFDKVLGLGLSEIRPLEIPSEIEQLLKERETARQNKDWSRSDAIRQEIEAKGWIIKDTDEGPRLKPNLSTG